jgi:hypothetical protein
MVMGPDQNYERMPWTTSTGLFVVTFLRQKHRISGRDRALIQRLLLQSIFTSRHANFAEGEAPRTAAVICNGERACNPPGNAKDE